MQTDNKLYYVHDPMCSWCWGYRPIVEKIRIALSDKIEIIDLVGGLARDSHEPMPLEMQQQIKSYWQKIESLLGTEFNYDFWTNCQPRRSTYPACRAVLAAGNQADTETKELELQRAMSLAIQQAYYLQAQNPSDDETLIKLAQDLSLDVDKFKYDLNSPELQQQLKTEIRFARSIGGNSFPSWFLQKGDSIIEIAIDYQDSESTVNTILELINR